MTSQYNFERVEIVDNLPVRSEIYADGSDEAVHNFCMLNDLELVEITGTGSSLTVVMRHSTDEVTYSVSCVS